MSNKYYVYLEEERTRIYEDDNTGRPITIIIDGKETTELFNTLTYSFEEHRAVFKPFDRAYEIGNYGIFTAVSNVCGIRFDFAFKLSSFITWLATEVINDSNCTFVFLLSNSFERAFALYVKSVYGEKIPSNNQFFRMIISTINKSYDLNINFGGTFILWALVNGVIDFLGLKHKRNLIYIDEKNIVVTDKKVGSVHTSFNSENKYKHEAIGEFEKYLEREALFSDEESVYKLQSMICHQFKKGNAIDYIELIRRDERIKVNCQIINESLEKDKKYFEEVVNENISIDAIHTTDVDCIVNYGIDEKKKTVEDILIEKGYNILNDFSRNDIFNLIIKYSNVVAEKNNILFVKNVREFCKARRLDFFNYSPDYTYVYNLAYTLKEKEREKIIKELKI